MGRCVIGVVDEKILKFSKPLAAGNCHVAVFDLIPNSSEGCRFKPLPIDHAIFVPAYGCHGSTIIQLPWGDRKSKIFPSKN